MTGLVSIQTDTPSIITIQPFVEEYWFAVLDRFVVEIMPFLTGADTKVQLYLFHKRDRQTSIVSDLPQSALAETLQLSPGQVSSSIARLGSVFDLATRRPLLLEPLSRSSWLIAPACRFKGARVQPAEDPPLRRSAGQTNVQPAERTFSRLNESPPALRSHTRGENLEFENRSIDDDLAKRGETKPNPPSEAVRMLTSGPGIPGQRGFKETDARAILAGSGASIDDVRNAIANANDMLRRGKLQKSWTGYVKTQLENGVTLFKHISSDRDNAQRVVDRLRRCASLLGSEDTCAAVTLWAQQIPSSQLARVHHSPSWRRSDDAFWAACVQAAMQETIS